MSGTVPVAMLFGVRGRSRSPGSPTAAPAPRPASRDGHQSGQQQMPHAIAGPPHKRPKCADLFGWGAGEVSRAASARMSRN